MKKMFILLLCTSSSLFYGQVGIGTDSPKATLDVHALKTDGSSAEGIIAPRLTGDQLALADAQYNENQDGAIVYINSPVTTASTKTGEVTKTGYYYYDNEGQSWKLIGGSIEPWYSTESNVGATSNNENIYQLGQIGIGISSLSPSSQLEVFSQDKGILIPRLDTSARDAITSLTDGLIIFNTTSNCFNYYSSGTSNWLSLCGTYDPATLSIICDDPTNGASGTFTQGNSINGINTYTVVINASTIGSYTITVETTNGYSFSKTGTFTATGKYTVVLEGQGTPISGGTSHKDAVTLKMNGIEITTCILPNISVEGSTSAATFVCPDVTVHGVYSKGLAVDASNYITIPVTVVNPGNMIIDTDIQNGIKFSSGSVAVDASTNSIKLYAQGTPINTSATPGTTYTFSINSDSSGNNPVSCTFPVIVGSTVGGFYNPAKNCLAIYNEGVRTDGEYWIKGDGGSSTKTYCDMTHGGYTLVWSYSENTSYSIYPPAGIPTNSSGMSVNSPQNVVTTQSGIINYNNYRLSNRTMTQARNVNPGDYKVRIANNATDMDDEWGNNNYFNVLPPTTGYDYISGSGSSCSASRVPTKGKLFGYEYDGTLDRSTYNGTQTLGNICPYVNVGAYGSHWDVGFRMTANAVALPIIPGGQTFHPINFNNLFGWHAEDEINHHFGKCPGDDFDFTTERCSQAARIPHSFNGGEGRVLQWFVK